eukprot:CAMPEP_0197673902 /NCGR_PEP_ID=MMETSP1338-20131121/81891_1 /TAXON_ID=43686 ORGANISM="Pelagodinium beii, Strain RCC1491" /NCGR_SAMPLE_ID=MMETSP1338 /ASSEMBLY_ACC=CAM_ASM_000754 /LENGTH=156 /DNA_ID=CAMNT_0043254211 /DNA_START=171 /DNA_END=637 /DNA_ORIENTATION=+
MRPASHFWKAKLLLQEAPAAAAERFLNRLALESSQAQRDGRILDEHSLELIPETRRMTPTALVAFCEAMAALLHARNASGDSLREDWQPPAILLQHLAEELDDKSFNLPPGDLWRACLALASCCSQQSLVQDLYWNSREARASSAISAAVLVGGVS